jgi:hypothetical protein
LAVSLRSSYTQKEKEPDSTHSGIAKKALYIQKFYYLRLDSLKWSVSFICFVYFTRGPVVLRWDRYGFPGKEWNGNWGNGCFSLGVFGELRMG